MNPSSLTPPTTLHFAKLRTALREAQVAAAHQNAPFRDPVAAAAHRRQLKLASQAVETAGAPLIAAFLLPLSRYCRQLARSPGSHEPFDGDDLAQDAWVKMMEYLLDSEKGDRIRSDAHFYSFLRQSALHLYLDRQKQKYKVQTLLDAPTERGGRETPAQQLAAPPVLPEVLQHIHQSAWVEWLHALFAGDADAFRAACRVAPRRRMVVYQAFVLISLAGFLRVTQAQTGLRGEWGGSLLRELLSHLPLPPPFWAVVEQAVRNAPPMTTEDEIHAGRDAGISDAIKESICAACTVPVMSRTLFHVLRNEVGKLAMGDAPAPNAVRKTSEKIPE